MQNAYSSLCAFALNHEGANTLYSAAAPPSMYLLVKISGSAIALVHGSNAVPPLHLYRVHGIMWII